MPTQIVIAAPKPDINAKFAGIYTKIIFVLNATIPKTPPMNNPIIAISTI